MEYQLIAGGCGVISIALNTVGCVMRWPFLNWLGAVFLFVAILLIF
jgi:hypothetical protein